MSRADAAAHRLAERGHPAILASDRDAGVVAAARENAQRAGVAELMEFRVAPISEAMSANVSENARVLCTFYMYRAYIEQAQYRMVLDEVGHNAPMPYISSQSSGSSSTASTLKSVHPSSANLARWS